MTRWLPVATLLVCLVTLLILLYFAWQTRAQFRTRFARLDRAQKETEKAIAGVKGKLVYQVKELDRELQRKHREQLKTLKRHEGFLNKLFKRQRDALEDVIGDAHQEFLLVQGMLSALPLKYPLFFGGWSIDGFVGRQLVETIEQTRPRVVLEIGSGYSTVLIAAVLAKLGLNTTRHIAVDHLQEFLDITARHLEVQGLAGRTELWCCPLAETSPDAPPWYQGVAERLAGVSLDLVLVDGPPGKLHPHARRPAMEVLRPFFSDTAVLILDDALRREERATVRAWRDANPELSCKLLRRGKGCAIFRMSRPRGS